MTTKNPIHQYETHLKHLEDIVQKMENGELSLEASLKAYEHGITLIRQCQQALNEAEQKVHILMRQTTDSEQAQLEPFQVEEDDD